MNSPTDGCRWRTERAFRKKPLRRHWPLILFSVIHGQFETG